MTKSSSGRPIFDEKPACSCGKKVNFASAFVEEVKISGSYSASTKLLETEVHCSERLPLQCTILCRVHFISQFKAENTRAGE